MAEKKDKHIHKLKRMKYKSGNTIFFCSLPDCNFKINIALTLGKRSICWRCGEPFIMSEYSLRLAKPHCEKCHKPKVSEELELAGTVVKDEQFHPAMTLAERLTRTIHQVAVPEEDEL